MANDSPDPGQWRLYLAAHCAKLRHWCRDLLEDSPAAATLPRAVTDDLSTPPAMSLDEAFDVLRRLATAGLKFSDFAHDSPDPEVRRLSRQREQLRTTLFTLADAVEPYQPVTDAELHDMLHGPRGDPILEIITELERGMGSSDRTSPTP